MSKFKAMKFWVGKDSDLKSQVRSLTKRLGYSDDISGSFDAIYTDERGKLLRSSSGRPFFDDEPEEEINIDWMRKPNRKTVKVGDKEYYEDELAGALAGIKEAS